VNHTNRERAHFYRNGLAGMGMLAGFAIGTTAVVALMTTPETGGASDLAAENVIKWLITEAPEPYATASIVGGSRGAAIGGILGGVGGAMLDSPNVGGKSCECK
ncbi:hypothetical protein, partial [Rhodanobacter sp. 115]